MGRRRPGPEKLSAEAAAVELEDPAGRRLTLASLWAEEPAVLVFLRHFG